jgi:hypothetical protein
MEENAEEYAKRVQRYGVDGVMHYASRLSKEFNVVAVAVSGDSTSSVLISTFLHVKGASGPKILQTKDGSDQLAAEPGLKGLKPG